MADAVIEALSPRDPRATTGERRTLYVANGGTAHPHGCSMRRSKDHEETPTVCGYCTDGHPGIHGSVRSMPSGVAAVRREKSIVLSNTLTVRRWTERHNYSFSSAYHSNAGVCRGEGNKGQGDGVCVDHGGSIAGVITPAALVRPGREDAEWEHGRSQNSW